MALCCHKDCSHPVRPGQRDCRHHHALNEKARRKKAAQKIAEMKQRLEQLEALV